MAHTVAQDEVRRILEEAHKQASGYQSADPGLLGLQARLTGIEDAIKTLARLFDQAYVEKP